MSPIGTVGTFLQVGSCSETLFNVVNRAFDAPLAADESATMPLAGGIMQHGFQCGMVWGAAFAAGAEAHRRFGTGPLAETRAVLAAQRVVESFRDRHKSYNCVDITGLDNSSSKWQMFATFVLKGKSYKCFHMSGKYAPIAYREIEDSLSAEIAEIPAAPVSCTALLAQKIGLSDQQTVMTAGLAGGIGLCGGACGALGAAIWMMALQQLNDGANKVDYENPEGYQMIGKFAQATRNEFECANIVGRTFKDVDDHAEYVRNGGCASILEALAEALSKR